jgi:O-acetyl-ADP-ribose deacetylase (regulator of RNase III)
MNKIKIKLGDICSVNSGIIIHGCNAQGVMGSGVAKAIRLKYPQVFEDYKNFKNQFGLELGDCVPTQIIDKESDVDVVIISAITQQFYGRDNRRYVDYDAVARVFEGIEDTAKYFGHTEVHFPLIGCGLGGGKWSIISNIIEESAPNIDKYLWIRGEDAEVTIGPKYKNFDVNSVANSVVDVH